MMKFEHELEVRYYETDQMGIVHHSNYVRYFECGRMAMLEQVGLPMHKIEEMGIMMPIIADIDGADIWNRFRVSDCHCHPVCIGNSYKGRIKRVS